MNILAKTAIPLFSEDFSSGIGLVLVDKNLNKFFFAIH